MALHFLYDVFAALCTRDARRGSHLTNSGMIERERGLDVTVSAVRVGRTFSKRADLGRFRSNTVHAFSFSFSARAKTILENCRKMIKTPNQFC
jgi:hypothetical protein